MAEFCVQCFNKLHHRKTVPSDYILSFYPALCEGCGKYKRIIISRRLYIDRRFLFLILLDEICWLIRELFVYLCNRKK